MVSPTDGKLEADHGNSQKGGITEFYGGKIGLIPLFDYSNVQFLLQSKFCKN